MHRELQQAAKEVRRLGDYPEFAQLSDSLDEFLFESMSPGDRAALEAELDSDTEQVAIHRDPEEGTKKVISLSDDPGVFAQ